MDAPKVGIIYLMKSVINGVYKIGISSIDNFESRMYNLEKNGYDNIGGLRRVIAIKTENYDVKERMLHEIFSKSRIAETEFFAVDRNLVEQLFYSLKGEVVFPKKVEVEEEVIKNEEGRRDTFRRRDYIELVKENYLKNPEFFKRLLGENGEFNEHGNKAKFFNQPQISPGGYTLATEIAENFFVYTNYNTSNLIQAKQDFEKLLERSKK